MIPFISFFSVTYNTENNEKIGQIHPYCLWPLTLERIDDCLEKKKFPAQIKYQSINIFHVQIVKMHALSLEFFIQLSFSNIQSSFTLFFIETDFEFENVWMIVFVIKPCYSETNKTDAQNENFVFDRYKYVEL